MSCDGTGCTTPFLCHVSTGLVGLGLLCEIPRSQTQPQHTAYAASGGVIAPSQRPLPDNTQHSQQTSTWQHTTLTKDLYLTTHNTQNRPLPHNTQHPQQTSTSQHTTLTTDLYLTTHNTHKNKISMLPSGFESSIPGSERPQTHALHLATTGIDMCDILSYNYCLRRAFKKELSVQLT